MHLENEIVRFVARVRQSPAASVDAGELDTLERSARSARGLEGRAARGVVARYTWMARAVLAVLQEDAETVSQPLGDRGVIVGLLPKLIKVSDDASTVTPPMEAIDIAIRTRGRRDKYTHRLEDNQGGSGIEYVNLPMVSAVLALRPLRIDLSGTSDPLLSFQFRWAVPAAVRTARGWGDTQISLGVLWAPEG